jgi:four helix bundle protein
MPAKHFSDLMAWKNAYDLSLVTYKVTGSFPKSELFGLTSQMRRSAVSVCSNIAEGFGRYGVKEKDQFYSIAKGSLTELEGQYLVAGGVGYVNSVDLHKIMVTLEEAQKVLSGLQKANKVKGGRG